jgi:hypothetical protein
MYDNKNKLIVVENNSFPSEYATMIVKIDLVSVKSKGYRSTVYQLERVSTDEELYQPRWFVYPISYGCRLEGFSFVIEGYDKPLQEQVQIQEVKPSFVPLPEKMEIDLMIKFFTDLYSLGMVAHSMFDFVSANNIHP